VNDSRYRYNDLRNRSAGNLFSCRPTLSRNFETLSELQLRPRHHTIADWFNHVGKSTLEIAIKQDHQSTDYHNYHLLNLWDYLIDWLGDGLTGFPLCNPSVISCECCSLLLSIIIFFQACMSTLSLSIWKSSEVCTLTQSIWWLSCFSSVYLALPMTFQVSIVLIHTY